jgi:hypothetical protein
LIFSPHAQNKPPFFIAEGGKKRRGAMKEFNKILKQTLRFLNIFSLFSELHGL